jgi:hypothetical protein
MLHHNAPQALGFKGRSAYSMLDGKDMANLFVTCLDHTVHNSVKSLIALSNNLGSCAMSSKR